MKIELEDFENTTSLYIEGLQKDKNMRYRSFDRYVRRAMKEISIDGSFNEGSVHLLNIFVEENDEAIKKVQKTIKTDLGVESPPMKVVDMYLWQRGLS